MQIIVCLKQTFDSEAKITLNTEGRIEENGVNFIINPNDEYAIEESIRLKEEHGGEVTVLTLGGSRAQAALRIALAMGADKAFLICDPAFADADEWLTAKILAQVIRPLPYEVIFTGKTALDDGASQVGVRLAEDLLIPSVTNIIKLAIQDSRATATRETDEGKEQVEVHLPALFTAQKGLNEPRYPKIAEILKAKKKEVKTLSLADLQQDNLSLVPKMTVDRYVLPASSRKGIILSGEAIQVVSKLTEILHNEVRVL